MKSVLIFLLGVHMLYLVEGQGASSAAQEKSAADRAFDITQGLYITLRNIAFPGGKISDDANVLSRFLLLMPGQVLNYADYNPGKDYINFVNNPDVVQREVVVPPHVMEKWFDIADVMPGPNPMNAQDVGKRLSESYRAVLYRMKPVGLDAKTQSDQGGYAQAVAALNELVPDPENVTEKVPRLALYERYRDMYNDRKLEMEDVVDNHRRNLSAIEYELWFQRHYPSLQAKVESTYTRWVIFGEKETVEYNVAVLDTGSAGQALEEARMALRASGVTSLDRTRKIYPVSFEPSNWYSYLIPKVQKPSRDQLQLMLGRLRSKINAIDQLVKSLTDSSGTIDTNIQTMQTGLSQAKNDSAAKTNEYMNEQINCLTGDHSTSDDCQNFETKRREAIGLLTDETKAFFDFSFANYFHASTGDYEAYLLKEQRSLQDEVVKIEGQLTESSAYVERLLTSSELSTPDLANEYKDDQWMQFEFDSKQFEESKKESSSSLSITSQMHSGFLFWHHTTTTRTTVDTSYYNDQLSNSQMTVKGELLRVTIKRPWFKAELFENPDLSYTKIEGGGVTQYVAPGREMTETAFYETLEKDDEVRYLLPEYTTGFLLARNVELEFKGVDSQTVRTSISTLTEKSSSSSFLFFHASRSSTASKQSSHVEAKKTADGMKIKIPGAQLIGYYTEKLPRFPAH